MADSEIDAVLGVGRGESRQDDLPIYPENWQAVTVFCQLGRCWRVSERSGKYIGIIRTELESTVNMLGIPQSEQANLLAQLQVMETAALEILNQS